jgi:hypothetical protein
MEIRNEGESFARLYVEELKISIALKPDEALPKMAKAATSKICGAALKVTWNKPGACSPPERFSRHWERALAQVRWHGGAIKEAEND